MLGFLNAIVSVVGAMVFVVAVSLGMLRNTLVMLCIALREWRNTGKELSPYTPPVTVLIAAHNEEKSIEACIRSVLASHYPEFHILIADDGSTDTTVSKIQTTFAGNSQVYVLSLAHEGKLKALLQGVSYIQTEFVIALDSDTTVDPETIGELMKKLAPANVAAVAGNIAVRNRTEKIATYQALGYMASNADRRALDLFGCVSVVPGAIGAWRKDDYVHALGDANIAGDVELTFRALRGGKQVRFAERARAHTDVPSDTASVISQRKRWSAEKWQFVKRHGKNLMRESTSFKDLIAGLHVVSVQALLPLVMWWADIFIVFRIAQAVLTRSVAGTALLGTVKLYIAFLLMEFLRDALAVHLEKPGDKSLLKVFPVQSVWNRQLHGLATVLGLLSLPKGVESQWNHAERQSPTSSE
ncbi:hypothetical protein COU78_03700 [Candidatus Peregrinibacteria bacterium CG10_big_fil_rev_8_21_14_0_10_49_24]|nr:MAG: hypothetical protein COV83_05520 [Candidatus Peregrinibacteria bacterium CG11_big_fil_rev_8_21_14_0_20_49_14]PIR51224.1 MAG: hypothetical protein COU78_03700 [Candidatus Peregrinibacteria bacterium CG10_big_fil_rev_8_21_14_0_10_49_24]PJA67262.1 MAG: hypothetical protein CO157_05855 [Candidatus Peregrinibacteria bacterium CG_4_9_14_3_um_filter_49_12]